MLAAPLLAGNDIRNMSAGTKSILTNKEVIAIDQDTLGGTTQLGVIQGRRVVQNGQLEVWVKKLKNMTTPDYAVCFFNRGATTADISVTWQQIQTVGQGITASVTYKVRDLWKHTNLSDWSGASGPLTATGVPSHNVVLLRLSSDAVGISPRNTENHSARSGIYYQNRILTLNTLASSRTDISLLDPQGNTVYSKKAIMSAPAAISMNSMNPGIYFVRVRGDNSTYTSAIVHR